MKQVKTCLQGKLFSGSLSRFFVISTFNVTPFNTNIHFTLHHQVHTRPGTLQTGVLKQNPHLLNCSKGLPTISYFFLKLQPEILIRKRCIFYSFILNCGQNVVLVNLNLLPNVLNKQFSKFGFASCQLCAEQSTE